MGKVHFVVGKVHFFSCFSSRVRVSGFLGLGFRVSGPQGLEFRVSGPQGLGFRV